jgi:glycosyltransferase involved in cell wall biosynthesis
MPRISIVMPTLNQQRYLRTAIDSILNQSCAVEVIVIDGGSTDGSLDILRSYGDQIRFLSEPDQGQSDALNKGLGMASGEIVGWLNSDDVYRPHSFPSVVEKFDDPKTQWVFGKVDVINEDGVEIRKWITSLKNRRLARLTFNQLLRANWISQMGVFWRRDFLRSLGDIEQNYHLAMDYDLWLRFWKKVPGVFLDQTIASFRIYESSKSGGQYLKQLKEAFHIARTHAAGQYPVDLAFHRVNAWAVSFIYRTLHLIR